MSNIDTFVAYQNSQKTAPGYAWQMDAAGINPSGESVIGFQSASLSTSYNNVVLLDGPRSQYGVQIDANQTVNIKDLSTGGTTSGQTVTVTGDHYLVFNGGNTSNPGIYNNNLMIVASGQDATLARMYQSTFGRMPDLAGLEAWTMQLPAHGGAMSLDRVAQGFLASPEFQTIDPPGTSDTAFITSLYAHVLNRTPDASGLAAWVTALQSGQITRSGALTQFAASQEELLNSASWMVDPATGGYADASVPFGAQAIVNQGTVNKYVNTGLMTPPPAGQNVYGPGAVPDPFGGVSSGLEVSSANGVVVLYAAVNNYTLIASAAVPYLSVSGTGNIILTGSTNATLNLASGNTVNLGSGNVVIYGATNTTITGFNPAIDIYQPTTLVNTGSVTLLNASTGQSFNGSALTFAPNNNSTNPLHLLELGSVGGGTAAEVAQAANAVYHLAGRASEHLIIAGQVTANSSVASSGDTVLYDFVQGNSGAYTNPDVNHNGLIDASELTYEVKFVGLTTSTITAHSFGG